MTMAMTDNQNIPTKILLLFILMLFFFISCDQKPEVAGVIIDGKANPISNMKIVATPIDTTNKEKQRSAITDENGKFSIKGLSFGTGYIIEPLFSEWGVDQLWHFKYEAEGIDNYFDKHGWWAPDNLLNRLILKTADIKTKYILLSPIEIERISSNIKGKLVDAKNLPLSKMHISAKPKNPFIIMKNKPFYTWTDEQGNFSISKFNKRFSNLKRNDVLIREMVDVDTWTDEQGSFSFPNLIPNTEYSLFNHYHKFNFKYKSPPEGKSLNIGTQKLRFFNKGRDGRRRIIYDNLTNLEWLKLEDFSRMYVDSSYVYPGGWTNPSRWQVQALYDVKQKHSRKIHPLFEMHDYKKPCCVWGKRDIGSPAYYFDFCDGEIVRMDPMVYRCVHLVVRKYKP
jgi:hypothetical protein